MNTFEALKDKLCDELDEIARKGDLSAGDLETLHKLTATIKNLDKIEMMEGVPDYSGAGEWTADMRGTYGLGSSYGNRGKHYVRGHYSRGNRREHIYKQLEDMSRDADDESTRNALRRCLEQLDKL